MLLILLMHMVLCPAGSEQTEENPQSFSTEITEVNRCKKQEIGAGGSWRPDNPTSKSEKEKQNIG